MFNPLEIINEIPENQQVWFVRTNSGLYYNDFSINKYVALGWDKIPKELILDSKITMEAKKEKISKLYPDEKRPGLILSQLNNFYCCMKKGDLVLIPSEGTKLIRVGILEDIVEDIKHKRIFEEYELCFYPNKRTVKWIGEIDTIQDVYLCKIIKVQQTISNISEYKELVYRNVFPYYIYNDTIHFTLKKFSNTEFSINSSVKLQSTILSIIDIVSDLYKFERISDKITIKMAVGSPGFLEFVMPNLGISCLAIVTIVRVILGKAKNSDGTIANGIIGLLDEFNTILNSHYERQKTKAETKTIEANRKIDIMLKEAELKKLEAETRKINAETQKIDKETYLLEKENCELIIPSKTEIESASKEIEEKGLILKETLKSNDIRCINSDEKAS